MRLLYPGVPNVRGDVVKPGLTVRQDGITIPIYGAGVHHSFDRLFVYHAGEKRLYPLPDPETAPQYFAKSNPADNGCPKGTEGVGVKVF